MTLDELQVEEAESRIIEARWYYRVSSERHKNLYRLAHASIYAPEHDRGLRQAVRGME